MQENASDITESLFEKVSITYKNKSEYIAQSAFPVVKNVYENQSATYENIVVPFTDGIKTLQGVANLKKSFDSEGRELVKAFEKNITLVIIDDAWKEHLREMDDLRQSVQHAIHEQKDPLLIYKFESFNLFKQMMQKFNSEIISFLFKGNLPDQIGTDASNIQQIEGPKRTDYSQVTAARPDLPEVVQPQGGQNQNSEQGGQPQPQHLKPVRVEKKVGRNEPCPCGSGKKYKQCHGR